MLSDEQLIETFNLGMYRDREHTTADEVRVSGLRAVEAAVRAECMTIEEHASLCGEIESLTEQLAAAQAVIAEARARLHAASIPPGMTEGQFNAITILDTRHVLSQQYAAIVLEPSTPEQEGNR